MNVDTDELVEILKNDQPINVTLVEERGKPKLIVLFALPELSNEIEMFARGLLHDHKIKKQTAHLLKEQRNEG
jgi:hypothetical protein